MEFWLIFVHPLFPVFELHIPVQVFRVHGSGFRRSGFQGSSFEV